MFVGSVLFPVGLFWFTWTGNWPEKIHWMAPTAAGNFIGFGLLTIFSASMNYIIDSYLIFAASAVAANTFLRLEFACAFPLFGTQMFHNMGVKWAGLLIACVGFVLIPVPFAFYFFGEQTLGDTNDQVVDQRSDGSQGSNVLSVTVVDSDLDLLVGDLGEGNINVLQVLLQGTSWTSDGDGSGVDLNGDTFWDV
ncbi:hypothetical protein WICPIJ_000047 [Wickerhamomyces pijperi]|uniref:Uncharacterized protein n=1 Tax=Wickerhamomyces pijperi TaxID=599730 RepID=A0A9P8QDJ9_WICPI|nr:hypothetical protein WICPIJ_000047 [Wickerhamomyces pijperi]